MLYDFHSTPALIFIGMFMLPEKLHMLERFRDFYKHFILRNLIKKVLKYFTTMDNTNVTRDGCVVAQWRAHQAAVKGSDPRILPNTAC